MRTNRAKFIWPKCKMSAMKDVLFCSNFCEHSKEVLMIIQKRNIRNIFVVVFVDNTKVQVPSSIDRVPALMTKHGQIIFGDDIEKYIETFCVTSNTSTRSSESAAPNNEEIAPFSLQSDIHGYSENFTFLDNSFNDNRVRKFDYVGSGDGPNVQYIERPESRKDSAKKSKLDEAYEKYVMDRDADIKKIMTINRRPL